MKRKTSIVLSVTALAGLAADAGAAAILLGSAGDFAVLAGSTATNTGPTVINGGHVGVSPGSAITGFPPGLVGAPYTIQGGGAVSLQAQADLAAAYDAAGALTPTQVLTGFDLGGSTLLPGVYAFASGAQLTGTLTLNHLGDPDAQFVFQVAGTLTTATDSSVFTINGGTSPGSTVFWQVAGAVTLGTGSEFQGHILALGSITLNTGATLLNGSALVRNGAVTLDGNTITNSVRAVPEPGTLGAFFAVATASALRRRRENCPSKSCR